MNEQEIRWIEQAKLGDSAAFRRLVESFQRPVYNLCLRMLGDPGEAEDAAQETFVRVFTKIASYRSGLKPSSWILSIASHYCIDRLRRRRGVSFSLDDDENVITVPSGELGPEPNYLRAEANGAVQAKVESLTPPYRIPLILRYWNDLSYNEIADVMGISVPAVKTRLHRARLMIQAQVEPAAYDQAVVQLAVR